MNKFTFLLIDEDGKVFGTNDISVAQECDEWSAFPVSLADPAAPTYFNFRGEELPVEEYVPEEEESDDEDDGDEE